MRVKNSISFILVIAVTTLFSLGVAYRISKKEHNMTYSKVDSYDKLWKKVDRCKVRGLSQSALLVIEVIYEKAKKENNAPQFVKAVLHRMKFESYREEFSLEKSIIKLRNEVNEAKYPVKPVLHSVLADAFWQYFQNNRWKFYNRTVTVNFKNDDIETWDLKTITSAVINNYKASLQNIDSLKKTKIGIYDEVLTLGNKECRQWRPTLYDFLAHRALSFFMNSEADVSRPASQFNVNSDDFIKPFHEFKEVKILNTSDSLELKYYALKLMQDLTVFHLTDANPAALIDVELLRLDYVFNHSQNSKKDTLYFSTLKTIREKFLPNQRVSEIDYRLANWYYLKSGQYKPLQSDNFKWYKKSALKIASDAIVQFPKSFGAIQCKNLIQTIQAKNFNLTIEDVNEPAKPFRALISSQNITKIYFKIVRTNANDLRLKFRENYGNAIYNEFLKLPVVKSFTQSIIDDGDYQMHYTEIKMPELETGYYVILTSLNENFNYSANISTYATCIVSDIATTERRRTDGSYDFYALHRQTGEPLKNISAQIWYENYDYNTREYGIKKGPIYKTDENGYLNVTDNQSIERQFYIEFINGKDVYFNNNSYYLYRSNVNNTTHVNSFLFTDRAIYRPGQTVYFKGIVLESTAGKNHELKINYPVTVSFFDVNYQKVASVDLITNEFGTVNGSFIAPQGGLNGQMSITDGYTHAYISVEEYKRPKFETEFYPVKGTYKLKDELTVSGFAKAYAGNVIDGAKVKYRVVRRINYPYWYWWYRPYFSAPSEIEITNGETITNDTGAYIIKFKALPDESVSKYSYATYNYEVSADVTDINGETHSANAFVTVGYQALQLNISSDEIIEINNANNNLKISTLNLNGVAETVKGKFSVYKLKQPQKLFRNRLWQQPDRHSMNRADYYKNFPNDLYDDETNKYKWERELKVIDKEFDTGTKTDYDLTTDLKLLKPGVYVAEAICKDRFGEEIKAFTYFTLFNKNINELPEQMPQFYFADKTTAEPGDKINYVYNSAYTGTNFLFEIERNNGQLNSSFFQVSMKPIQVKVEENDRGNFAVHASFIKHNRFYNHTQIINVPFTNKELDIQFETFRNKLLPGQAEEWKLIVKDKRGERAAAEMLAAMYDASLDAFKPNNWLFNVFMQNFYSSCYWTPNVGMQVYSTEYNTLQKNYLSLPVRVYDCLNYYGLHFYNNRYYRGYYDDLAYGESNVMAMPSGVRTAEEHNLLGKSDKVEVKTKKETASSKNDEQKNLENDIQTTPTVSGVNFTRKENKEVKKTATELGNVKARSNFNETAFFYPELRTNDKGEIVIKFTAPESLTKWKVMGLTHTKDLKYVQFQKEIITQKDLMVQPNIPRFFRENDRITLITKIANLSDNQLTGNAELKLFDALTEQDISDKIIERIDGSTTLKSIKSFTVNKGLSTSVEWNLTIPEGYSAIKYKIVAKSGNFSDGEEMAVPVLTNRMLVTESMPLPIRSHQTKEFNFTKFINQNNNSSTLKNHAYTLEFTANPAWYAVQALPYIMEYPYECAEQTFARYYANSLATYVVNSKPKIKSVFDAWKSLSLDAFLSNLEKNQELKSVVLQETPWLLQAKNESENKKRVGLLFDLNRMSNESVMALKKLIKKQTVNGGFMWFEGMPDDWYITQHITSGFGHLNNLGVVKIRENEQVWSMLNKAVKYCDDRMNEEFEKVKKFYPNYKTENHLSYNSIQYLYMRSFYKDIKRNKQLNECFDYYKEQEQKYWLNSSRYMQAMIALSLNRYEDNKTPKDILKSLKENSINSEEMGMYWKENYGYYWYQAPVEMQALMIEAFDEITNDTKAVDDLKTWLIKSKQTQHWATTRATTEAVYALLLKGTDWLSTEPNVEITVGDIKLDPKNDKTLNAEPGTGYFKKSWFGSEINPQKMGKLKVVKKDAGVSYGAVYWQYFEQLDKITPHETPLKLKKQLFLQKNTGSGIVIEPVLNNSKLKPGDKLKVRIELRVDRDMSYVHMKDMRASGFEPVNVFSGYKYQDGLGYYESTGDAATNFFFSYLNKGTYVFEYPLVVNHYGNFSNGITTIQCMYAPEFTSHSEGIRVEVKK